MSEENPEVAAAVPTKVPEILTIPSGAKILHTRCEHVKQITPVVKALAQELEGYLKTHQHDDPRPTSISAPQLGNSVRMFSCILNVGGDTLTVINPELVYEKKIHLVKEACLSLPGKLFLLKRGKIVKIRGMLIDGSTHTFKEHGLMAQSFLHELNHLDGITIDTIGQEVT